MGHSTIYQDLDANLGHRKAIQGKQAVLGIGLVYLMKMAMKMKMLIFHLNVVLMLPQKKEMLVKEWMVMNALEIAVAYLNKI